MSGPANQTRFRERMQARGKRIFHPGLCRIRGNDFQIAALSQRKERVLRAAAGIERPQTSRARLCVVRRTRCRLANQPSQEEYDRARMDPRLPPEAWTGPQGRRVLATEKAAAKLAETFLVSRIRLS